MLDVYTVVIIKVFVALVWLGMIFLITTAAIGKVVYITIQPGQIFGGWQNVLNKLDQANSRLLNALYKPLGGCEFCFSHLIGVISFALFVPFVCFVLNTWPLNITHSLWANIGINIVGYLMYVCTSTILTTLAITRL